jgi:hypothetical protein
LRDVLQSKSITTEQSRGRTHRDAAREADVDQKLEENIGLFISRNGSNALDKLGTRN